jgi:hypothetical protein
MSHFTVLVAAKDREDLEAKLQPFHEFECDGVEDEYVKIVDRTDEWQADTHEYHTRAFRMPDGSLRDYYDDEFTHKRPGTEDDKWYPKGPIPETVSEQIAPEGAEEIKITYAEAIEAGLYTFAEWVDDWSGGKPIKGQPGRYGKLTNPNARWDWWVVGGRWTGLLHLKEPANQAVENAPEEKAWEDMSWYERLTSSKKDQEAGENIGDGTPGMMTPPNRNAQRASYAPHRLIDWQGMLQDRQHRARQTYETYHELLAAMKQRFIAEDQREIWEERYTAMLEHDNDEVVSRTLEVFPTLNDFIYHRMLIEYVWKYEGMLSRIEKDELSLNQKLIEDWIGGPKPHAETRSYTIEIEGNGTESVSLLEQLKADVARWQNCAYLDFDELYTICTTDLDSYMRAVDTSLTWAFIDQEGKWVEKATMGWWGLHDDVQESYDEKFWAFVNGLEDDDIVYVIDCHI